MYCIIDISIIIKCVVFEQTLFQSLCVLFSRQFGFHVYIWIKKIEKKIKIKRFGSKAKYKYMYPMTLYLTIYPSTYHLYMNIINFKRIKLFY